MFVIVTGLPGPPVAVVDAVPPAPLSLVMPVRTLGARLRAVGVNVHVAPGPALVRLAAGGGALRRVHQSVAHAGTWHNTALTYMVPPGG